MLRLFILYLGMVLFLAIVRLFSPNFAGGWLLLNLVPFTITALKLVLFDRRLVRVAPLLSTTMERNVMQCRELGFLINLRVV